ncbi:hypothetical protein GCM10011611_03170 [Aliidongia dinghuensis]|uniref:Uncharacterized protein n=2 Tax=Aliidongia dinghuensis TaxID=1867774 RepID=A0A8J3E1D5_9PROT|nr:hypothetical protein GCM10011611_03170 [Aliidongia dinghuensis]
MLVKLIILPWLLFGPVMTIVGLSATGYATLFLGIAISIFGGAFIVFALSQSKQEAVWYRKQP